jgi:hypothetical protein
MRIATLSGCIAFCDFNLFFISRGARLSSQNFDHLKPRLVILSFAEDLKMHQKVMYFDVLGNTRLKRKIIAHLPIFDAFVAAGVTVITIFLPSKVEK